MASSSKPTAVHFTLIFFVMLSIILSVVAYLMYREVTENEQRWAKAQEEFKTARAALGNRQEDLEQIKQLLGHEVKDVAPMSDTGTVLGRMAADIRKVGGNPQQETYNEALERLNTELNNLKSQNSAQQATINDLNTELNSLRSQYQAKLDEAEQKMRDTLAEMQQIAQEREEERAQAEEIQKELRQRYNQVALELDQARSQHDKAIKEKEREIRDLVAINTRLREKIDQIERVSFERADGVVRRVDHNSGLVWINLGEADNLSKRTTFSVYEKSHQGVARGGEDIKGAIEVTQILGPHLAEARIQENELGRPIAARDPIYTPLWSPGRAARITLAGVIDLDGDGESDREQLYDLIRGTGSTVDNDLLPDGTWKKGSAEGIDVRTKFVVVGGRPDPAEAKPSEVEATEAFQEEFKSLRDHARRQAVREISLNRFLEYMGYRPRRRVWRPGMTSNYTLRAGSRRTAVDEAASKRTSSGQVSGAYRNGDQAAPQESSGSTSGLFRGGY